MESAKQLILGEHRRLFDERYRIALPQEFLEPLGGENAECVLNKERNGCLSLWRGDEWQKRFGRGVELLQKKLELDLLGNNFAAVQRFSRLLSTHSRPVKLGQRGRLLVPEGFREFLEVEPNTELLLVGAGLCVEIWKLEVWKSYLRDDMGEFSSLFQQMVQT